MRFLLCLMLVVLPMIGCASSRPGWVRTFSDQELEATPLRHYDLSHLFARRTYAADADFDLNEALAGSSGPSTDLDWSYQAVWEDQARLISKAIADGLDARDLSAVSIETGFQGFNITATPEVHAAIEDLVASLDSYRNHGWEVMQKLVEARSSSGD
ncbi:MAG: hypothetical protein AAGA29_06235 [Planctomycetota bacterium]